MFWRRRYDLPHLLQVSGCVEFMAGQNEYDPMRRGWSVIQEKVCVREGQVRGGKGQLRLESGDHYRRSLEMVQRQDLPRQGYDELRTYPMGASALLGVYGK